MGEVRCADCGAVWGGCGASGFLRQHACIGTPSPTVSDLLAFLNVEADENGCLLPTENVSPYRRGRGYWWVPRAVARIVGEHPAHRAVLRLKLGRPIEDSMYAAHECAEPHYENSKCVNPDHLHERTRSENAMWVAPAIRSERFGGLDKVSRIRELNERRRSHSTDEAS